MGRGVAEVSCCCAALSQKRGSLSQSGAPKKLVRVSGGGDAANGDFASLVAKLFDFAEEGIFRKIMCFL